MPLHSESVTMTLDPNVESISFCERPFEKIYI